MQPPSWSLPPPTPPSGGIPPANQSGCLHALLFTVACAWVIGVTIVAQSAAWFYDQFQLLEGVTTPGWFWVAAAFGQALLLALPVGLLAALVRSPRFRAAYRTWRLLSALPRCSAWRGSAQSHGRSQPQLCRSS